MLLQVGSHDHFVDNESGNTSDYSGDHNFGIQCHRRKPFQDGFPLFAQKSICQQNSGISENNSALAAGAAGFAQRHLTIRDLHEVVFL